MKIKVEVEGIELETWLSVRLERNFDTVDTLAISYPFEPRNQTLCDLFRPLSFNRCKVSFGEKILFQGVLLSVRATENAAQVVEEATFYALSGNLIDCTFPSSKTKLQFDNQTLKTIFSQIADDFGLDVVFAADSGGAFDKVACRPDQKLFSFMSSLSKQRGLVISSLANGGILVRKGKDSGPLIAKLEEGKPPMLSASFNPDARQYFSEACVVTTGTEKDNINARFTTKNAKLSFLRPLVQIARDTDTGSVKNASEGLLGRMFATAIKYNFALPTWTDSNGNVFETNTFLQVLAPSARIFKPYTFMISKAELIADSNQKITNLTCVLPTAYSNKVPETLPWDQ